METQEHEESALKPLCLPPILFACCSCDLSCSGKQPAGIKERPWLTCSSRGTAELHPESVRLVGAGAAEELVGAGVTLLCFLPLNCSGREAEEAVGASPRCTPMGTAGHGAGSAHPAANREFLLKNIS